MKYKYLLVDDFGSVWGCNSDAEALRLWNTGSYLAIDLTRMASFEDVDEEAPALTEIPDIESPAE